MREITRKYIDWDKTAKNLKMLRLDNLNLRRYVCSRIHRKEWECEQDCDGCRFEMDNAISQRELALVFNVSENLVVNWENGKTQPKTEDLIFYSQLCDIDLFDVIVLQQPKIKH